MKSLGIVFLLYFIQNCKCAAIVSQTDERGSDFYRFSYTLDDGTERYEEGILRNENNVQYYKVTGHSKYIGTDGKIYIVDYFTDPQNGYRASVSGK